MKDQENRELWIHEHPNITDIMWRRKGIVIIKTLYQRNPEGKIPLGRPRMRWKDQV